MGFWVTVYKIDETLPESLTIKDKEMINSEITPGIYKHEQFKKVDSKNLTELKETLEEDENIKESDIVMWQPDDELMNHPTEEVADALKNQLNFFIKKFWGLDSIALESEKVFAELQLDELRDMIGYDNQ